MKQMMEKEKEKARILELFYSFFLLGGADVKKFSFNDKTARKAKTKKKFTSKTELC